MLRTDFKYNGKRLSDFQMQMFDPDQEITFPAREIARTELTSRKQSSYFYTAYYKDPLVIPFLIIRNPNTIEYTSDYVLSDKDIYILRSWLESPTQAMELKPEMDDEEINVSYFGVFSDVQPFVVGERCMGLKLTFTCNSPYGYTPITSKQYKITDTKIDSDFINNSVQFATALKPTIIIKSTPDSTGQHPVFNGETLEITNKSDGNKTMTVTLPAGLTYLSIDCQKKMVTDENGNLLPLSQVGMVPNEFDTNSDVVQTYNMYWFDIIKGNNELSFEINPLSHPFTVEIKTRYIVKGGAF